MQLREYQIDAVNGVRHSYQLGYRAPILVLPTGAGKTIVFSYIAHLSASGPKPKKVLILVHRVELLRQTANKLRAFGVRVGLISPLYTPDYSANVQVGMVQTMVKRSQFFQYFDLIITDECHHAVANQYKQVVGAYCADPERAPFQLGVTATPIRSDGKGLGVQAGGPFDRMVLGPSVSDLVGMGHLVQPIVYASEIQVDMSGVGKIAGDWNSKQAAERVDKPMITGHAVDHYRSICNHSPAVAFCQSVTHAEHVAAEFRAFGYRAESVDGGLDDQTRERRLSGLGDGSINVICSCDLISEGTDIPAITAAILLRPTQSLGLFLQQVGRALRPVPGKDRAFVLDHVANVGQYINGQYVVNHGFPDDDREWSLDGIIKEKKSAREKAPNIAAQCPECYAVFTRGRTNCPYCNFRLAPEFGPIEVTEGQLVEVSLEDKMNASNKRKNEQAAARTYDDLLKLARERGYKDSWAKRLFDARQEKALKQKALKS